MRLLHPPHESFVQRRPEGGRLVLAYEGAVRAPNAQLSVGRVHVDASGPLAGSGVVVVEGLPAGGPFELVIDDGTEPRVQQRLYCGDLWLMAGQSNMEGVGLLAEACPPHPLVRAFSMARRWKQAVDPLHVLAESPDAVHHSALPGSPLRGAGVGLPFGRLQAEATGVPQGLIAAAHGGTSMAQWNPAADEKGGLSLYGSLLASVRAVGQPLCGVLWFQGCSDTDPEAARLYTERMTQLVATLGRDLGQPELAWLTVQIGVEVGRTAQVEAWHEVQEQQRRLPQQVSRLDVAASADLEHDDWIHVSARDFPRLAARLGAMARRLVLGADELPLPQPLRVRWAPDEVSPALELDCGGVKGSLQSLGLPRGFALRDAEGRERKIVYQVRFEGPVVRLRLTDDDLAGVSLFHGLGAEPVINTYDERGFPLPVFGPLPIEGLPPVSAWLRHWFLSAPVSLPLEAIDPSSWPPEGLRRRWEGWNVIALKEDWKSGPSGRVASTWVAADEAMVVEVVAGGDGPLRVWWDGHEVITAPEPVRDLSTTHTSAPFTVAPGRYRLQVAMTNRGGEAWGFYVRLRRTDGGTSLPYEADPTAL